MFRNIKHKISSIIIAVLVIGISLSGVPVENIVQFAKDMNVVDVSWRGVTQRGFNDWRPRRASAATFQMQTGYYMGSGTDNFSITGVGFRPDLVMIKDLTTNGTLGMVVKTSSMSGENTAVLDAATATTTTNIIQSLDNDGFTLGTHADVNTANIKFNWVAFGGSDCSSTGTFCVGSYNGDGAASKNITVGFQPDVVIVKSPAAQRGVWRSSAMPDNYAQYFGAVAQDTGGSIFKTLNATGFTIGNSALVNTANKIHFFIAFKNVSTAMYAGTFTGNDTDNRSIADATNMNFTPDFVIVKNANATTTTNISASWTISENYRDYAGDFADAANANNYIQRLISNGFEVGFHIKVNGKTHTMYYLAFGGATDRSPTGSFRMATGSYSGNRTTTTISGLGFVPDLVIIRHTTQLTGRYAVFRTSLMKGQISSYLANAAATTNYGITALTSDGFTVAAHEDVNNTSDVYHWQAFGNAFHPEKSGGSSDFAVGVYVAPEVDNTNITRLPFQPDLVAVKRNGATAGVFRTSAYAGDFTSYFTATAEAANMVQSLTSDGFQIGTTDNVSVAGGSYHWFAFKAGSNFKVGSYSGNGTGQTIASQGYAPDLVWVKRSTAVAGIFKSASMDSVATVTFINNATAYTTDITTSTNDGFTVGNGAEANTNGGTYRYATWHAKTFSQRAYRLFNNADSTDVGSALAGQNTAASLTSGGQAFRLRMLLHASNSPVYTNGQLYKLQFAGKGSGTCAAPSGGTPETYTDIDATTAIAYNTANSPSDNSLLTSNNNDPTHEHAVYVQAYEEANTFSNTKDTIRKDTNGMWDFALKDNNASANTTYCVRAVRVNQTGSVVTVLDNYAVYPEITTAESSGTLELTASTTQSFSAPLTVQFVSQTSTMTSVGAISVSDSRGGSPGWTLTISGSDWKRGTGAAELDYDGGGSNDQQGKLCIKPQSGNLYAQNGSTSGVSKASNSCFDANLSSLSIISANGGSGTGVYWLTDMPAEQYFPPSPTVGSYTTTIVFTLS